MEEDPDGCESIEEGGGSNVRQRDIKKIEREGCNVMCNTGLPLWPGDGGTDRDNNQGCRFARTNGSGGLRQ